MPYTVPYGTFDDIEHNVADSLSRRRKKIVPLLRWSAGLAVAASIALLIVVRPAVPAASSTTSDDVLAKIDIAYANLSESDQEYLVEIYNDDIFINQK